jgi:hypothetical protein
MKQIELMPDDRNVETDAEKGGGSISGSKISLHFLLFLQYSWQTSFARMSQALWTTPLVVHLGE